MSDRYNGLPSDPDAMPRERDYNAAAERADLNDTMPSLCYVHRPVTIADIQRVIDRDLAFLRRQALGETISDLEVRAALARGVE